MQNRALIVFGSTLIIIGLASLLGALFDIDFGTICWPTGLILLGLWLLLRPKINVRGAQVNLRIFGDVRRRGEWQLNGEEHWLFIGSTRFDLSQAEIPAGETPLRVFGFIGDVKLIVPEDVGVSVSSIAFINDTKIFGDKRSTIISPIEYNSAGYELAERKVRLETALFIADIDIYPTNAA